MIEEWELACTPQHRIRQRHYEVAVLPLGATEPHNLHLPEGIDFLNANEIARRCCRAAWGKCQSVVCLPAIPYGVDCNLLGFPLTIHVSQMSLDAMVRDIILSLRRHGIRKVVIFNGHGGNEFMALIRQMQADTDIHLFLCNWWQVGSDRYDEIFQQADDHGGEMETSVAMALWPELVQKEQAASGQAKPFALKALREGWVRTSRDFSRLNDYCGVGNPQAASAEKGRKYLEVVCARISEFLIELAETPIDNDFPHRS